ncbi:alpha/beta hydrolase [Pseudomonas sp.]|uniref:alpha/beta hydrolase n=1 Tax=Pseudomonas sp. TaxID=306 RepID=UPI00257EDD58|nr:alpha/beta hydrolase [Pseudomonas sp.]
MLEQFKPERLVAGLRPLTSAPAQALPQELAYRAFYGLEQLPAAHARMGYFDAGGYRIAAQLWLPEQPRATLILLHGYYDHSGLYGHVMRWALEQNLAVMALDLPGHGLSSGTRASINDFAEYQAVLEGAIELVRELQLPAPLHLFGQSTGGAILIDYLLTANPQSDIGETILLAPLVRPRAWGWSKLSYLLLKSFVSKIERRFSDNSHDPVFLDFLRNRDPLQSRNLPTAWVGALGRWVPRIENAPRSPRRPLVVQGEEDRTVDWPYNLQVLADKFAGPRVLRIKQARHHLANESAEFRAEYFSFLTEQLNR